MDENAFAEEETRKTASLESTLIYFVFYKHSAELFSIMIVRFESFQFIRFFLKFCDFLSKLLDFSVHFERRCLIVDLYKKHL